MRNSASFGVILRLPCSQIPPCDRFHQAYHEPVLPSFFLSSTDHLSGSQSFSEIAVSHQSNLGGEMCYTTIAVVNSDTITGRWAESLS
jgi:hypothetical protein